MKIGIDIDDTIVDTYKYMIKYADIYDVQVLGGKGSNNDVGLIETSHYLDDLYNWDRKTKFDYFDAYYKNVLEECNFYTDAVDVLKKIKKDGNEIYFITARVSGIKDCNTEEITRNMLLNNGIEYDKLIIDADDKAKYCVEHGIDLFIDDSYVTCKKIKENGIKSYLMTTVMNENVNSNDIERVKNWKEIYNNICNISK